MIDANDPTLRLVSMAFGAAVDPDRFEQLLDAWDVWWDTQLEANGDLFEGILGPFEEAASLSQRVDQTLQNGEEDFGVQVGPAAALLLKEDRTVLAANHAAKKLISLGEISVGTFAKPAAVQDLSSGTGSKSAYRIGGGPGRRTYLAIEAPAQERLVESSPEAVTMVVLSLMDWNTSYAEQLSETLNLSPAELKVARGLFEGLTAQEISGSIGRSVATIRSHIKSLLKKTGARRQTELVQFLTILRQFADAAPEQRQSVSRPAGAHHSLIAVEGGVVDMLRYGAGQPVLYFTTSSPPEETDRVRTAFSQAGLQVFAPARPGFAGSTSQRGDASQTMTGALLPGILDHVPDNPVLVGHREGGILAAEAAAWMVGQGLPFAGLVLISTGAPVEDIESFRKAPSNERRSFLAARFAKPALTLGYNTAARLFRSSAAGQDRIVRYFFGTSPADKVLLDQPEYYEVTRGIIDYSFQNPSQIVRDIALWGSDWSASLRSASAVGPVAFVHGTEHNFMSIDAVAACVSKERSMSLNPIQGAGQLALYQSPEQVADTIRTIAVP